MESRVIPLQLLQSAMFPFFCNLIILPCVQSSGSSSFSHIFTKRGCRISAAVSWSVLKTSAHNESVPEALLFPRVAIAALVSAFFGGDVSISRSLSAGWMSAGCCGSGLFSTSLKCSVHLRSCSTSLVSNLPYLSMSGGLMFPQICFVILCTMLISFLEAAVSALFASSSKCFLLSLLADFLNKFIQLTVLYLQSFFQSFRFGLADYCFQLLSFLHALPRYSTDLYVAGF